MLEILAYLVTLLVVLLAKRKPSRRRFTLRRVRITPELALSTLASDTAVVTDVTSNSTATYRVISVSATWGLSGGTVNEGPLTVGFCHSDYTVTEIKECLEAQSSISPGQKIEREQANRLVRIVGVLTEAQPTLNDGKPIKTRLNWLMAASSDNLSMFVYNEDTAALTTGGVVHCQGSLYVKDAA